MEWKEEHDVLLCHEILVSQPFKFKERTVERGKMWDEIANQLRLGSHLRQKLDKFALITKKSVKFLLSVDHAKCDLLVSTRTKICPRRQIFKGAVLLPRSTTFCEQN